MSSSHLLDSQLESRFLSWLKIYVNLRVDTVLTMRSVPTPFCPGTVSPILVDPAKGLLRLRIPLLERTKRSLSPQRTLHPKSHDFDSVMTRLTPTTSEMLRRLKKLGPLHRIGGMNFDRKGRTNFCYERERRFCRVWGESYRRGVGGWRGGRMIHIFILIKY